MHLGILCTVTRAVGRMRQACFVLPVSVLLLNFVSTSVHAQNFPNFNDQYVNDYSGLLSTAESNKIRQQLEKHNVDNATHITLAIIQSRSDYGSSSSIEAFATALFNQWGIGHSTTNNGVLILIAKHDREMRIELGASYGTLRNSLMEDIIENVMVPQFKKNNYTTGIEQGINSIIIGLSDPLKVKDDISDTSPALQDSTLLQILVNKLNITPPWIFIVIGTIIFLAFIFGLKYYLRYRTRTCKKCNIKMQRLDDYEEDQYLDEGTLMEEMIKSVDYDVWRCSLCNHRLIKRYTALFSGYGACPDCHYKTLESDTSTVSSATEYSTGKRRIDYHCVNCDYSNTEYQTIPRKTRSSSSSNSSSSWSSGSSSSSSGGSSSGGGASGSW